MSIRQENGPSRFYADHMARIMSFCISSGKTVSWTYPERFSFEMALGYLLASVENELVDRENHGCDDCSSFIFDSAMRYEELETVEMLVKEEIYAICGSKES